MVQFTLPRNSKIRTGKTLAEGRAQMTVIAGQMDDIRATDRSLLWISGLTETPELTNRMPNALTAIVAAQARKQSRGGRAHEDYPNRDDANWRKHSPACVDVAKVVPGCRPAHLDPTTTEEEGGISLKQGRAHGAGILR